MFVRKYAPLSLNLPAKYNAIHDMLAHILVRFQISKPIVRLVHVSDLVEVGKRLTFLSISILKLKFAIQVPHPCCVLNKSASLQNVR
jgi:hypothetical protein